VAVVGEGATFALAAVAGVLGNQLKGGVWWPWLAFLAVLVIGTLVTVIAAAEPTLPPPPWLTSEALVGQAEALAGVVRWQLEWIAGLRDLQQPSALQVRWESTSRPVSAERHHLSGNLDGIADTYQRLAQHRLVVLGEPGAGKTVLAILLTLELLKRRTPQERVPVLLRLSTWNPAKENLYRWLASQITREYFDATRHTDEDISAARRLVHARLILPVLDGLDELAEDVRVAAIRQLDQHPTEPLIVTCRSQEYQRAVNSSGVLTGAAVVELQPVEPEDVKSFLRRTAGPLADPWREVFSNLEADPDSPLAAALSTPLMVSLARTVYSVRDPNPGELIELAATGGQVAVERHLLHEFIPAAYADPLPGPVASAPEDGPVHPDLAERYLRLLATHLRQLHTDEFAWWQLPSLVSTRIKRLWLGPATGFLIALPVGLAAGLAVGFPAGVLGALVLGTLLGIGIGSALAFLPATPTRVNLRPRGSLRDLITQLKTERVKTAVETGGEIGGSAGSLMGMLGLALLIVFLWVKPEVLPEYVFSLDSDRDYHIFLVLLFFIGIVVWYFLRDLLEGLASLPVIFVFGFMELLRSPVEEARAITPKAVLRSDRAAAFTLGTIGGLLFGLVVTFFAAIGGALAISLITFDLDFSASIAVAEFLLKPALAGGLFGGLLGMLCFTAWGQFIIVRVWLTICGRLPWRLVRFLDGAHSREVLRRAGAIYQFRHARLVDYLTEADRVVPQPAVGGPAGGSEPHGTIRFSEPTWRTMIKAIVAVTAACLALLPTAGFITEISRNIGSAAILGLIALLAWGFIISKCNEVLFRPTLSIDHTAITFRCYNEDNQLGRFIVRFPLNELSRIAVRRRGIKQELVCTPKPESGLLPPAESIKKLWSEDLRSFVIDLSPLRRPASEISDALRHMGPDIDSSMPA